MWLFFELEFMSMKSNNAFKNMWLRAETVNQKLKNNAQTQDAYGIQAFPSAMYDIAREHISTKKLLIGGGGGGSEPSSS